MEEEEREAVVECAGCGAPVDVDRERGYRLSESMGLCWSCALARGLEFDEEEDRWRLAPDMAGLAIDDEHRVR